MLGYYFFLGRGDWGTSRENTWDPTFAGECVPQMNLGDWGLHRTGAGEAEVQAWTSRWSVEDWKQRLEYIQSELGADTVYFFMNGFELPYASAKFPEIVEIGHKNVESDYFQEVLDHAKKLGLYIVFTFGTTGHAVGFAKAHPECTTVNADGERHEVNLCHNHPMGRGYAEGVIEEVMGRYQGVDGVCFHPPEGAKPCYCEYCHASFAREVGKDMSSVDESELRTFYWKSCLRFQRELEELALSRNSELEIYSITIPEFFENEFDWIGKEIRPGNTIMHWDYWNFDDKVETLLSHLDEFRRYSHKLLFIPSAGWNLDKFGPDYGPKVVDQVARVKAHGIEDIVYFIGGIWSEEPLRKTSWVLNK